ncbi:MAG: LLM class flavin-dependent oxidoreductase [Acidimicrobiales bacterium]
MRDSRPCCTIGSTHRHRRRDLRWAHRPGLRPGLRAPRHAEALGIDTIWLTEHHFVDDATAFGGHHRRRHRRGHRTVHRVQPAAPAVHNAVRVAEDIATADVIGGRIDPGWPGLRAHEFAGYGIPLSERLSRFVEGLDVVQGLWSQDTFSYEGRHYRIDGARLVPKPVQDPMPLWIGATTVPAVRRAGLRGANLLGTGASLLPAYEEALQEGGFPCRTQRSCSSTSATSPAPTTTPGTRRGRTSTT